MCYQITAVVGGISLDELSAALNSVGSKVRFTTAANPHIQGLLAADETYLMRADCQCDCGTWLGKAARPDEVDKYTVTEKDLVRLKAKGWSEQRVKCWVAEKQRAAELAKENRSQDSDGRDGQPWMDVVKTALEVAQARSFGLLLHWYSGSLSEPINATRREFSLQQVNADLLAEMPKDTLFSFTRKG
ncbi:MAG: hypothetical protein FWG47_02915 [Propionibacteriaceae bacterium]|nr:hypothetical protein [Propionibacteriaceae bacterium]